MATVYAAHDVKHDRRVALKVLHRARRTGPPLQGSGLVGKIPWQWRSLG
jgi:hypothetical protein